MSKKGALTRKWFKKKIYLLYLQLTGLLTNTFWHATSEDEAIDIKKHFPNNKGIIEAPNIPKVPLESITTPLKERGKLRLVYLSLVNEHKNVLLLLQLIQSAKRDIVLEIYGPIIDMEYWEQCKSLIQQMPGKVQGRGTTSRCTANIISIPRLILLTKGENFGHAIYESLSVGRPVITSYFTPWNDLQQKSAGANVDINDLNDCIEKLASHW